MSQVYAIFRRADVGEDQFREELMPQHVYSNRSLANKAREMLIKKHGYSKDDLKVKHLQINNQAEEERKNELLRRIKDMEEKILFGNMSADDKVMFCAWLLGSTTFTPPGQEIVLQTGCTYENDDSIRYMTDEELNNR